LVHKRANSKIPGWLAICQSTTGVTTTTAALLSVTLGPWSDFIKEFGFVLPKHQTKMQMWAHDRRRSAVQLKTAVLLLRETATRSSILSLTSRLAIRLRTTSMAFCQMSVE